MIYKKFNITDPLRTKILYILISYLLHETKSNSTLYILGSIYQFIKIFANLN